ncbi:MAG: chain length determinant protein EpsF [Gammaproteobacteria bacterium]
MNLQRLLLILRSRIWFIVFTFGITVASALILSLLMPKTYTASTSMVIDFKSGDDPLTGGLFPAQMVAGYMATQLDIIASHKVALEAVDKLKLDKNPEAREQFEKATEGKGSIRDWLADELLDDMKISPSAESSLIELSYSSTNPVFSAAVANAFAESYINTNLQLKVNPARQTASWFGDQLKILRDNLAASQERLSAYQQDKGIIAADEKLDVENARLEDLSSQLVKVQTEAQDFQTRQDMAKNASGGDASLESLPEILSNPFIQALKENLAEQEAKVAELSGQVGVNHPQYKRALRELSNMQQKVKTEVSKATRGIANSAQLAQQREAALKEALAAQKKKILALKQGHDDIAVYVREVENAQKAYDTASQRFSQTSMESQLSQTNVSIISPAIPPIKHSQPKIMLNVALAIFFGGLLSVGLAFMAEMANRYIRSQQDILDDLNLPVLGVLNNKIAQVKVVQRQPQRLTHTPGPLHIASR